MFTKKSKGNGREWKIEEIIDTRGVELIQIGDEERKLRNARIKGFLQALTSADLAENSQKQIASIPDEFIDYFGQKLDSLFCKYASSPWLHIKKYRNNIKVLPGTPSYSSFVQIFSEKTMNQLLEAYYRHLNPSPEISHENSEAVVFRKNMEVLFGLIEKEFASLYSEPMQEIPPGAASS